MFRAPPQQQPCRPRASLPSSAAFRPCRRHRRPFQPPPLRRPRRPRRVPSACRPSDLPLPRPLRPALLRPGQLPLRLRPGLLRLGRRLLALPLPRLGQRLLVPLLLPRLRPGLLLGRRLLASLLLPRRRPGPPSLPPSRRLLAPPLLRLRPGRSL